TAVDSVASRLVGYENPLDIPVLKEAYNSRWGTVMPEEIEVLGDSVESLKVKDFKLSRKGGTFYFKNPRVNAFLRSLVAPSPSLIPDKCIGCKRCQEVCPEKGKVITMVKMGGKTVPKWEMKNCIRCFCCQELCPVGAIETRNTTLAKVIGLDKK
ncbi:MAG: 4Fe-4S dicluster domain-containing protein, partial [Bacillota bacterium]|nr:4Fe-4S dicluster domain-containing protein [Bacillota bacterium]